MEIIGNLHSVSFPVNAQGLGPEMDKDKVVVTQHELWDDANNSVATCRTVGIAEEIARRYRAAPLGTAVYVNPRTMEDIMAEEDAKLVEKCRSMLADPVPGEGTLSKYDLSQLRRAADAQLQRLSRDRHLTPDEAAKYNDMREKVQKEFPPAVPLFAHYLKEELDKLRQAVADAGLSVMQTSGKWSLHDVSGKFATQARYDDDKTTEIIMENIELKKKLREMEAAARQLHQAPPLPGDASPWECRSCGNYFKAHACGHDGGFRVICPACGSDEIGPQTPADQGQDGDEGCRAEHRADRQHTLIDLCYRTRYIYDEDYPD